MTVKKNTPAALIAARAAAAATNEALADVMNRLEAAQLELSEADGKHSALIEQDAAGGKRANVADVVNRRAEIELAGNRIDSLKAIESNAVTAFDLATMALRNEELRHSEGLLSDAEKASLIAEAVAKVSEALAPLVARFGAAHDAYVAALTDARAIRTDGWLQPGLEPHGSVGDELLVIDGSVYRVPMLTSAIDEAADAAAFAVKKEALRPGLPPPLLLTRRVPP
ncbi:hypothetical protein [Arthrobacter sp. LAR12-1-1.1]|uniref:hypothetical protein n=1 Tax=Arthrobacter sp. LAR12-1-1.1 TaxID=3135215 RepID=UPI0034318D8F